MSLKENVTNIVQTSQLQENVRHTKLIHSTKYCKFNLNVTHTLLTNKTIPPPQTKNGRPLTKWSLQYN